LVVAFWSFWAGNAGRTMSSLTINGAGFTIDTQLADGATADEAAIGVAHLASPATGSQTFAWVYTGAGAMSEGGEIVLVYYTGANISDPVRASAVDARLTTGVPAATIGSTATSDRVVGFAESFTGTNPTITGVTALINDVTVNSHVYDVGDDTGLSGSVTVGNSTPAFSTAAAISLKAS
jgi:hypothetical protein